MRTSVITFIIICALTLMRHTATAEEVNMQLFDIVNLDAKGLEQVKTLYNAGNYRDAASALLDYYKGRTGIVFTDLNLDNLTLSDSERQMADDALEHRFFAHKGYQPSFFYGDDIDWTYWPVQDNELRWQLHRLKWFIPMGKAYRVTGDEKYAAEWVLEYLDWIKKNPCPETRAARRKSIASDDDSGSTSTDDAENARFAWRPLEVSHRLQDQAAEFLLFNPSPSFTPEFFSEFLVNVNRHANYIIANYSSQGNHLLFEAQRVLYAGIFFPELKLAESWRSSAIEVLNREINVQVFNDGVQFELDPHYHLAAINIFFKALGMADANGYRSEFPDSFLNTVEKMIAVTYNLSFPDYTNPMFSDAKLNTQKEMLKNYKQWYEVFPKNDTIRWFATQGKRGAAPAYKSRAFTDGGFYVMRTGWNKDATVFMLKAGPKAFWHCQPDNGTFELMFNGRNFFTDSGSYVYEGDAEVTAWRKWFRRTASHKTLTLDDRDLEQTDSHCLLWQTGSPTEVLVVENPSYEGLKHRRSVFFVEGKFFVIVDEAVGNATGRVGLHYQLCEGPVKIDAPSLTAATTFDDGNNVVVQSFASKGADTYLEEEDGWVSYEYNKKTARTAYVLNTDKTAADDAVRLITVIYPTEDAASAPTISAKFSDKGFDENNLTVTVKIGKKQYKLNYDLLKQGLGRFVTNGDLSETTEKYKLGSQSLQWDWEAGSTISTTGLDGLSVASVKKEGGIAFWLYNPTPIADSLSAVFTDRNDEVRCELDVSMNFKGWRYITARFQADMGHNLSELTGMFLSAPQQGSGCFYLDTLTFPTSVAWDRIDDMQYSVAQTYPGIDNFLSSYKAIDLSEAPAATTSETKALSTIMERAEDWFINKGDGSTVYASRRKAFDAALTRGRKNFSALPLTYDSNGVVNGPGLFPQYFDTSIDGESIYRFRYINENLLLWLACDYRINGREQSLTDYLTLLDWMADQGWAAGSGLGGLRFEKLRSAGYFHSLFLMRNNLGDERLQRELQTLHWFALTGDMYAATDAGKGETADNLRTLAMAKLYDCLLLPDANARAAQLHRLHDYLEQALVPLTCFGGTFKPDGSGYHHRGSYMGAYYPDALYALCQLCYLLSDTPFALSDASFAQLRESLLAMADMSAGYDVPTALCGRFPTSTDPWKDLTPAVAYLIEACGGTDTALNNLFGLLWRPAESPLSDRIARAATDICYKQTPGVTALCLRAAQYIPSQPTRQEVFRYYPFSGLFVWRTGNLHITFKGFSRYIWDFEATSTENPLGRYMSYGNLEYTLLDTSTKNNAYANTAWDWNCLPGTTAKALSTAELDFVSGGGSRYRNFSDQAFLGGTTLADTDTPLGICSMVMHDNTFDDSFYARKSLIAAGQSVLCLGSDIRNNDAAHPTYTTLLQQAATASVLTPQAGKPTTVSDATMQYEVLQGSVEQTTTSSLNTVLINHGKAPQGAAYAYTMRPTSTTAAGADFSILQQDAEAHIVGIPEASATIYALFDADKAVRFGRLTAVNRPVVAIIRQEADSALSIAVADPDLRHSSAASVDNLSSAQIYEMSEPALVELTLQGSYEVAQADVKASASSSDGTTRLSFETAQGATVRLRLEPSGKTPLADISADTRFRVGRADGCRQYLISCSQPDLPYAIRLFDTSGRLVRRLDALSASTLLDLTSLPAGHFVLRIDPAEGAVETFRLCLKTE